MSCSAWAAGGGLDSRRRAGDLPEHRSQHAGERRGAHNAHQGGADGERARAAGERGGHGRSGVAAARARTARAVLSELARARVRRARTGPRDGDLQRPRRPDWGVNAPSSQASVVWRGRGVSRRGPACGRSGQAPGIVPSDSPPCARARLLASWRRAPARALAISRVAMTHRRAGKTPTNDSGVASRRDVDDAMPIPIGNRPGAACPAPPAPDETGGGSAHAFPRAAPRGASKDSASGQRVSGRARPHRRRDR